LNALFRLLDRQGKFTGDINYLQRLALQETIKEELRNEYKKETMRFKVQTAIAYPEVAERIFADKGDEHQQSIPDIEEYNPDDPGFSEQGISTMMQALEQFGFYAEELDVDV
jgi:hypothetical protein